MSVDVHTEIVINRPVDEVAAYATDQSNAPEWYANIDSVDWQTPPPATVGSKMTFVARFLGRRLEYTYEFVDLVPGERLVMRTAQGPFPMERHTAIGSTGHRAPELPGPTQRRSSSAMAAAGRRAGRRPRGSQRSVRWCAIIRLHPCTCRSTLRTTSIDARVGRSVSVALPRAECSGRAERPRPRQVRAESLRLSDTVQRAVFRRRV